MRSVACQTYERGRNPLQRGATEKLQAIDRPDLCASGLLVISEQSNTTDRVMRLTDALHENITTYYYPKPHRDGPAPRGGGPGAADGNRVDPDSVGAGS